MKQISLSYSGLCLNELISTPGLQTLLQTKNTKPAEKNSQDWQADFLQALNQVQTELPMDKLRAHRLAVDPSYKTQVCCDLVAMQMTHRGAYLLGARTTGL
ncbi:MAG: hypothetical protein Q9M92_15735 [Enterobacterales bacterium]|nr:hypothetical protein [Enterobacterales bacterium]